MEPGIFTGLFQKTIKMVIAVGSLFYSSIDGIKADFSSLDIGVSQNVVIVSTQLINCYSDDLDQIFKSGERVTIHYKLELYSDQDVKAIFRNTFSHSIRYSLLDKTYDVFKSEFETVQIGLDIVEAKYELSLLNSIPTIGVAELNGDSNYYFQISAWMDDIQLRGMEKRLNLMYYWSSIRPVNKSSNFNNMISIQ